MLWRKKKQLEATCILTQSSTVSGTINIKQFRNGVRITGQVKGIPAGKHGFHVHQYGDLSNGCASFGGHFNPFGLTHGAPTDQIRHVGDLGNIVANSNDISNINIFDRQVSLVGKFNVFGRGLVIHAGVDDLGRGGDAGSLATGNAGSRLACCIIVHKA
ncbi:superoxide dismutase [Cu-Zn]-like [Clytia hemisphaerica]|uniref:superoxide dismutase [Cu-Zn]-like n=1 Tax=Clytia hemisphaerica TaxID=252671 RepID=UPI0034D4B829